MRIENVYRTEGVPTKTFIEPPNYAELLVDIRNPHKPVIIEGQSGTGKTTVVKKILERETELNRAKYLSARITSHLIEIEKIANSPEIGVFVIDDFHRITADLQEKIANLAKISAEEGEEARLPKLVLIGINQVGSGLIQLVPDLAKRFGIHRVAPADQHGTLALIQAGETDLNIKIQDPISIYIEAQGDYWLTQLLCQTICISAGVTETCSTEKTIVSDLQYIRTRIINRLHASYSTPAKEFCRGRRFRPSNDPYFKLLKKVAEGHSATIDLTMLANSAPDIRASIISIKDGRLRILLDAKPDVAKYFYFNEKTSIFAIEDPALFYYLKHLNWDSFRAECGFRAGADEYEYDVAISFAGENRELARYIAESLNDLDVNIFFDEYFENNYLGKAWGKEFKRIFSEASRFIVVLLDKHHLDKIWPTFERDCFIPRIKNESVIPIRLDNSIFAGIPNDIVSIYFPFDAADPDWKDKTTTQVVYRLIDRIA